jgi:hypothetical protein
MTEDQVRAHLDTLRMGLLRRDDGYYDVTEGEHLVALLDWRVEEDERNDRGGEIGSPYPLTLDEIFRWTT